jgi:ATP synthase F1 delta subunit
MQSSPKKVAAAFIEHMKPKGIEAVNSAINELNLLSSAIQYLKLPSFFKNPKLTVKDKMEWLTKICKSLEIGSDVQKMSFALLNIGMLSSTSKVLQCMKELRLSLFGVGEGTVMSVTPLTDSQKNTAKELLKKIGGFKEVLLKERVNPNLLGGITLSAGDKLVEGSILHQIKNLLKIVS